MYQLAGVEQVPALLAYFEQDLKNCLYGYIDLKKYGIQNPHLHIYYSTREGHITAVATEYYKGIQLFSYREELDVEETLELVHRLKAPMINGKQKVIAILEPYLRGDFAMETGYVTWMKTAPGSDVGQTGAGETEGPGRTGERPFRQVECSREEDFPEIARLICSDEGLGGHYMPEEFAQQMLDRKKGKFGRSYIIRRDGKIVSHASTYAEIDNLAIVSGVITRQEYRGLGLGYEVVSKLCQDLILEGKRPCLFYFKKEAVGLYAKAGFEEGTLWGKLSHRH